MNGLWGNQMTTMTSCDPERSNSRVVRDRDTLIAQYLENTDY